MASPVDTDKSQLPAAASSDTDIAPTFPGEKRASGDAEVDHYAKEIRSGWRTSVAAILLVCRLCEEARKTLDYLQRQQLIKRLPFEEATFSKLCTIGRNRLLLDEKLQKHLPANWSIIYQLRNLKAEELQKAISEKVLTPDTTRNELNKWLSENSTYKKDDRRRAEPNKTYHEGLLQSLLAAWEASPEIVETWRKSPKAVRSRFFQAIGRL